MKRLADRRTILLVAGTAVVAAVAAAVSAQSADIGGTVEFESGAVIPKGEIEIYLEDPSAQDDTRQRAAETRVESDGGSKSIDFSLSPLTSSTAAPSTRIVARLERSDGWLLARGSAELVTNSPVHIILHTVLY